MVPRKDSLLRLCLVYVIVLVLITVFCFPSLTLALGKDQRQVLDSGARFFNIEDYALPSTCKGSGSLTGSDNIEKVWNFFIAQGFKPFQAAGIMGNMRAEANFEPRLVEFGWPNSRGETSVQGQPSSLDDDVPPNVGPQGQPGYGLIQWTSPGRKQGLRDLAAENAVKGGDLGVQLKFIMKELNGSYYKQYALDPLLASTTIEEATDVILENYEIPGDIPGQRPIRRGFAQEIFDQYGKSGGTTTSSPGSSACGTSGSGQVVDGYSLPLDRRLFDEHPDWVSAPHHTYPATDLPVPIGTNVYSMTAGTIIAAPVEGKCGTGVLIKRDDGVEFMYCHGTDGGNVQSAKEGQKVVAGQLIMHSGNTGESTGPHLHVEILVGGTNRCPQPLMEGIIKGSPPQPADLPTSGCVG